MSAEHRHAAELREEARILRGRIERLETCAAVVDELLHLRIDTNPDGYAVLTAAIERVVVVARRGAC